MTRYLISIVLVFCVAQCNQAQDFFTPKQDLGGLKNNTETKANLPNVLLIGDSISIGYTQPTIELLKDVANVHRVKSNCGDTNRGVKNLKKWLGKTKWDVIHFNWGLHDLCYRHPDSKVQGKRDKVNGSLAVSLDQYEKNLESLVLQLKATNAKLIWASTTHVPEKEAGRIVGDEVKYNSVAVRIMQEHDVAVNDLHSLSAGFNGKYSKPGDVHFSQEGSQLLANQVNLAIRPFVSADAADMTNENRPPNFVVFLVDDLGYMDIGANNPNCFYETPFIDQLAKTGMRFTNGYAANPVCSPTRYSLMTGKYPTRVQATNFFSGRRSGKFKPAQLADNMPLDEITIAQALKGKGYATFFAGKWHLGESEEYYPQNRGFDVNIGGHKKGGPYTGKRYFAPFENPEMKVESPAGEHLPARLARDTVDFIKTNKDKPFLAYLSFYSVHTPLMGRPDLVKKYKARAAEIVGEEFAKEEQVIGPKERKVRILQKHAVYAAMVEAMDEAIGKVLQELEDSNLADNTVVIFTSDNGGLSTSEGLPTSNLPLRGGKGWVYEGGIREPWIVRYPGVTAAGTESAEPICSIDLFPTIASSAGIKVQHAIDGIDLHPVLKGEPSGRDALYWHYPHYSNQGGFPGGAIRQGDFKLVERYEDGKVHLYNLDTDIGETNDLAETMPERVVQMRGRLHDWYKTVDAKFLQPKDQEIPWQPESK